jgi:hypothetical protein
MTSVHSEYVTMEVNNPVILHNNPRIYKITSRELFMNANYYSILPDSCYYRKNIHPVRKKYAIYQQNVLHFHMNKT